MSQKKIHIVTLHYLTLLLKALCVIGTIYISPELFCDVNLGNLKTAAKGGSVTKFGSISLVSCEAKCLALNCGYIDYVGGICYIGDINSQHFSKTPGIHSYNYKKLNRTSSDNLSHGKNISSTPAGYDPTAIGPAMYFYANNAIDGDFTTMYQSWPSSYPYFALDLGEVYKVTNVSMYTTYNSMATMYNTEIYVTPTFNPSDNYSTYPLFSIAGRSAPVAFANFSNSSGICGRYVVFYKNGAEALSFMDIYVYAAGYG